MTPTEFETLKLSAVVLLGALTLLALSVCPWLIAAWVQRRRWSDLPFLGLRFRSNVLRASTSATPATPSPVDPSRSLPPAEPAASGLTGVGALLVLVLLLGAGACCMSTETTPCSDCGCSTENLTDDGTLR